MWSKEPFYAIFEILNWIVTNGSETSSTWKFFSAWYNSLVLTCLRAWIVLDLNNQMQVLWFVTKCVMVTINGLFVFLMCNILLLLLLLWGYIPCLITNQRQELLVSSVFFFAWKATCFLEFSQIKLIAFDILSIIFPSNCKTISCPLLEILVCNN